MIKVGIIGGGPSGLSTALQLSRKLLAAETLRTLPIASRDRIEIHLYEKRSSVGPSHPWATDVEPKVAAVHTLHFFAFAVALDPSEPDAFINWVLREQGKSPTEHPDLRREVSRSFPSRAQVGRFLAHSAQLLRDSLADDLQAQNSSKYYVKLFEHTDVEVTNIHAPNMVEYRRISPSCDGSPTKTSPRRLSEAFNYLVICTGHIPSRSAAAATFIQRAPLTVRAKYIDQAFPICRFHFPVVFGHEYSFLRVSFLRQNLSDRRRRSYWNTADRNRCGSRSQSQRTHWKDHSGLPNRGAASDFLSQFPRSPVASVSFAAIDKTKH